MPNYLSKVKTIAYRGYQFFSGIAAVRGEGFTIKSQKFENHIIQKYSGGIWAMDLRITSPSLYASRAGQIKWNYWSLGCIQYIVLLMHFNLWRKKKYIIPGTFANPCMQLFACLGSQYDD